MTTKLVAVVVGGGLATSHAALAQDFTADGYQRPPMDSYAWSEPRLRTRVGVGVTLGGGVSGFTAGKIRDALDTNVSGTWAARLTLGTHTPLGVDASYTGTFVDLRMPGSTRIGSMTGTNVEGALRWNILPHYVWNPYAFAGVGWQRYDVNDVSVVQAQSAGIGLASTTDNQVAFPMGVGLAFRDDSGVTFDARGTFRPVTDNDLFIDATGEPTEMHTWEASGNLGYEF